MLVTSIQKTKLKTLKRGGHEMKEQNVMQEDWDYLIILDACRYDYFEKVYDDYFDGELEKRDSGAGATPEWLTKTFTEDYDYFDISYFSANPYINSKGISLNRIRDDNFKWKATDIFDHIVDLWESAWDENLGVAGPEKVCDKFRKSPKLNRCIIHIMQPHRPFLHPDVEEITERGEQRESMIKGKLYSNDYNNKRKDLKDDIGSVLDKIFGQQRLLKIREFLGLPPLGQWDELRRTYSLKGIKKFYEYNIRVALKAIKKLLPDLDGKVIITADHGEGLLDCNFFGHENFNHSPVLITVPWFEVRR